MFQWPLRYRLLLAGYCSLVVGNAVADDVATPRITFTLQDSGAKPKKVTEMSHEERRVEFTRLYRDDLPYAAYIRSLADRSDAALREGVAVPKFGNPEWVYARLLEALRYLTGVGQVPARESDRRYQAMTRISGLFERGKLGLDEQSRAFHREVFHSSEFQQSDSVYRDAVIDLWQRFEKAELPVPYYLLFGLNQPGTGRSGDQSHFYNDLNVGDLYSKLGRHETAAQWYAKVPAEGLGPLKAADAYFRAEKYADAERLYRHVLDNLEDWTAKKPDLRVEAFTGPLADMDPVATRQHVTQRLAEIRRIVSEKSATRPAAAVPAPQERQ